MNSVLSQIRAKITNLETKIVNLRIAEQELLAFEPASAQEDAPARLHPEQAPRLTRPSAPRQTIGAAITEVLATHGALSVSQIAEAIEAGGREIDRRKVSFALQVLKKQGLVKLENGNWVPTKVRAKRVSGTR